jgi:hypothetical protein
MISTLSSRAHCQTTYVPHYHDVFQSCHHPASWPMLLQVGFRGLVRCGHSHSRNSEVVAKAQLQCSRGVCHIRGRPTWQEIHNIVFWDLTCKRSSSDWWGFHHESVSPCKRRGMFFVTGYDWTDVWLHFVRLFPYLGILFLCCAVHWGT